MINSTFSTECPNFHNWFTLSLTYIYGLYLALIALIDVGSYPVYDYVEY